MTKAVTGSITWESNRTVTGGAPLPVVFDSTQTRREGGNPFRRVSFHTAVLYTLPCVPRRSAQTTRTPHGLAWTPHGFAWTPHRFRMESTQLHISDQL